MRVYASAEMTLTDTNDGISVTGIDRYYMASSSSSGITVNSQGWKPDPQETNPVSRYHWSYEVVNYSDGVKIPSKPAVIGVYGKDGKEGIDAVTVSLSSEAHSFAGTESRAIASSTTIDVYAFKGSQRIPTSIGTVTGGIAGQITHSELGRGTTNNKLVINATSSLAKGNGTLSIPIVADGRTFNKVFSWSVAFRGIPGEKGTDGTTTYTWIRYADTPTSGMENSPVGKKYIGLSFNQTTQTESNNYNDYQWSLMPQNIEVGGRNLLKNSEREFSSVGKREFLPVVDLAPIFEEYGVDEKYSLSLDLKTADATSGRQIQVYMQNGSGTKYNFVADMVSVTEEYQRFKFEGLTPSLSMPTETRATLSFYGTYDTGNHPIVRRIKLERGNIATDWTEAPEDTQSQIDDTKEQVKKTVKTITEEYYQSTSSTSQTGGSWTTTAPTWKEGRFIFIRSKITYVDDTTDYTPIINITGAKGDTGAAGTGIKSAEISYVIHTNGTTAPTLGWISTVPTPAQGRYLWTRTITTYTDNTTSTTYSVAYQATNGQRGDNGADGTGVSSTAVTYAQTTSGTTTPTSWSATRPAPIKGQYLWSRTIITYTNGSSSTAYNTSYSATDGQKGDKGDTGPQGPQGIQGPSGSNGQSQWVHIRYSVNSNGSGMTTSPSGTTKYVGIAVTSSATAPAYTGFTWSKYVGENGVQGPQGVPGKNGANGTTTYTWVRYADTPTSEMSNFPEGKKYIGLAFNKITQTESNNNSDYQWSLMPQNIEVGGRNLLLGSQDLDFTASTKENYLGKKASVWEAPISARYTRVAEKYSENFIAGQQYTFSFLVSYTGTKGSSLNLYTNPTLFSYTQVSNYENVKEGGFTRVWVTTTPSVDVNTSRFHMTYNGTGKLYVADFKVEKGNTATDWTPSPEDTEAAYTAVAQAKAEAERVKAEAYADDKVTDEEKARIKDADAKLAAAKQHAENISKVQDIGNGDKKFINVGNLGTKPSSATGYLVIKTPLTSPYMTKMKISGYNYRTSKTNIDISVSFYAYSNNAFHNYSFISSGNYSYSKVQLARDSSGKTVVIIGNQSDAYSYPKISIDEALVTQGTPPDSFKDGFSAEIVTDISMYTNVVNVPGEDTKLSISDAQTAANNAATAASNAQGTATAASNSASTANSLLSDIASDSKLTATEKKAAKKEWDVIVGEKPKIDTSANTYGIITEKTAYNTAYNTLNNYLSGLLANLNTTSNIVGTTFRANFKAYYDARQDLLNKIADGAKSLVDGIEIGGRNYFTKETAIREKTPGAGFEVGGPETPNGFKITGRNGGDTSLRINNVITSNGWWTVSFDIRGTQSTYVSVSVDINDKGSTQIRTNNTNTYERKSVSVYVDNYSETTYNFVDFDNFGWAHYLIDNIKVETGNKATGWTPSPEDVAIDVNKKTYNPVRYIRDWSNGSTANSGNHWYELMAIDEDGNNKALNRTVTTNGSTTGSLHHLTDGVTAIGTYVSTGNSDTPVYVQVDLGKVCYDITEIKVWKYYNDGRTYHESKTEVSSDGVTWYPIYDYTVEGEYPSTEQGKSIPNTIAKTHSIITGRGTKNVIDQKANAERVKAEAYADGVVTAEERKRIADAEDKYRKALILSRASSGKLMNSDPNFSKNLEEFKPYNNASNGNVTILYEDEPTSTGPSGVTRRLKVTTTGTASPTWGGIVASPTFTSRANAEYVIRFTALLPKGRSFQYNNNSLGTGYTGEWLTSSEGTGSWEEYAYYYKCGSTGPFSTFGYMYTLGGTTPTTTSPLVWYLDKYEALDISNVTGNPSQEDVDGKASAEDLINAENGLSTSIGDLSSTVDGKVDKTMYEEFLEHNANIQEQLSTSTANAQEDITKALARTATVEQKLGEGAADWIFTHTQIRMSDEGITLGEEGSGSYLQITNDQISFYNGSAEPVAFINGGMLNINHAIFVESIQISEFMFSSEAPGHLTLRYVGN